MSPLPLPGQMSLLDSDPGEAIGTAVLSEDGLYRYHLTRDRPGDKPPVVFVMLNPSTADASINDPTIKRCIGFADAQQASSLHVVNLFAYRTPSPKVLWAFDGDRIGPENDEHLRATFRTARISGATVIAAWGADKAAQHRAEFVNILAGSAGITLHALRTTGDGSPGHPLYLPKTLRPKPWTP